MTSTDVFVEAEHLQELDGHEEGRLVELAGDVEKFLQVPPAEGAEHAAVHQLAVEGLGVLGQAHVAQPGLGHPVVVHLCCLGESAVKEG